MNTLVNVPYWWHATLLEILWLAGGLAALILTSLNLHDAWKDRSVLSEIRFDSSVSKRTYEMLVVAVHGRLESQVFRALVSCLIVGAGIFGVVVSNPLGGLTTLTGLAVSTALVGISLLTGAKAWLDLTTRNRLYALAAAREDLLHAEKVTSVSSPTVGPDDID